MQETSRLMSKYPGHVPITLVRSRDAGIPPLRKSIYMIPEAINVGNLLIALRKDVEALFVGSSHSLVSTCIPLELRFGEVKKGGDALSSFRYNFAELVGTIYDKHRGEDGYLVVSINMPRRAER